MTSKTREIITLGMGDKQAQFMVSHVADAFGLVDLQLLGTNDIEFVTLTEAEIERFRVRPEGGDGR